MIAIAGAGYSGCVLARLFAEAGHTVSVYEREPDIGGLLRQLREPVLDFSDRVTYNWFSRRTQIVRKTFSPEYFMPQESYAVFLRQLLDHNQIRLAVNAPVIAHQAFLARYQMLVFTGDVDRLFGYVYGRLPYTSELMPVHSAETERIRKQYKYLCEHYGVIQFGMCATFAPCWMHQIFEEARRFVM